METLTKAQQNKIHTLIGRLGWTDFVYRNWLDAYYKVTTSTSLDKDRASTLISDLAGILQNQKETKKANKITKKQSGMILWLWQDVDYSKGECGNKHLVSFLEKRFSVSSLYDLTKFQANLCIRAIQAIQEQAKKREGKTTVLRRSKCKYCGKQILWVQLEDKRRVPFDFDSNNKATDFHECLNA